jgi:hypothetical protein
MCLFEEEIQQEWYIHKPEYCCIEVVKKISKICMLYYNKWYEINESHGLPLE